MLPGMTMSLKTRSKWASRDNNASAVASSHIVVAGSPNVADHVGYLIVVLARSERRRSVATSTSPASIAVASSAFAERSSNIGPGAALLTRFPVGPRRRLRAKPYKPGWGRGRYRDRRSLRRESVPEYLVQVFRARYRA
jgi:hypothetical protein